MTNRDIVDKIAREGLVRNIINRITESGKTATDPSSLCDLEQDIYVSLLEDKNLQTVYEENHLNYYIARSCTNNICSSSSRYYRTYLLSLKRNVELIDNYGGSTED